MRKLIAAINVTLDGFCDHTAIIPDEEMHQHYADPLTNSDERTIRDLANAGQKSYLSATNDQLTKGNK